MPGANGEIERRWAREQEVMLARIERDRLEREGKGKCTYPGAVVRGYERVEKKIKKIKKNSSKIRKLIKENIKNKNNILLNKILLSVSKELGLG